MVSQEPGDLTSPRYEGVRIMEVSIRRGLTVIK